MRPPPARRKHRLRSAFAVGLPAPARRQTFMAAHPHRTPTTSTTRALPPPPTPWPAGRRKRFRRNRVRCQRKSGTAVGACRRTDFADFTHVRPQGTRPRTIVRGRSGEPAVRSPCGGTTALATRFRDVLRNSFIATLRLAAAACRLDDRHAVVTIRSANNRHTMQPNGVRARHRNSAAVSNGRGQRDVPCSRSGFACVRYLANRSRLADRTPDGLQDSARNARAEHRVRYYKCCLRVTNHNAGDDTLFPTCCA